MAAGEPPEFTRTASTHALSTLNVELGERSYPILIGTESITQFAACVDRALGDLSHAVVIYDEQVRSPWADSIIVELDQISGVRVSHVSIPSGESSKCVEQVGRLWDWMLGEGTDRRSVVFAVGGGVVGDLAGFIAASFTRGIRFVQVPTSLLAMVDSSVGGKTGINLPGAKNMVGAFWQPQMVWIDSATLKTMGARDYVSGLAEVVKYGVIDDASFFQWLQQNASQLVSLDDTSLRHAIRESCASKARVVRQDERETSGRRAILNYGHTFAHAIEATAGYGEVLHGEAVSIGMQMAMSLAIDLGLCDASLLPLQTELLQSCHLPITFAGANPDEMLPVMMRDKKVAHGKLRFVLPTKIGRVDLFGDVPEEKVRRAIELHR